MFDFNYITPEEYYKLSQQESLEEIKRRANMKDKTCDNCENKVWKLVDLDMCFSCVTGETDASEDYELIPSK